MRRAGVARSLVALLAAAFGASVPASAEPARTTEAVAVWQHRLPGGGWDVWYALLGRPESAAPADALAWWTPGGGVGEPLAVLAGADENPAVGVRPGGGEALAVWQHAGPEGQDIWWSSLEPGGTWRAPARLGWVAGRDYDPAVAVDPQGNALSVWVNRTGEAYRLMWATFDGTHWSPPAAVPVGAVSASLPEVTFLDRPESTGALLAYSDLIDDPELGPVHRVFATTFDETGWSPPLRLPVASSSVVSIPDHAWADYAIPQGAFDRIAVAPSAGGKATVLWGGAFLESARWVPTELLGASLDPATGMWAPLRWQEGELNCPASHSPAATMTGSDDMVVAAGAHGGLEHVRRVRGAYASEAHAADTEDMDDLRPALAPLNDGVVMVSWQRPWSGVGGRVAWAFGTLRPPFAETGSSVTWSEQHALDLPGQARYPSVASGMGGTGTPLAVTMHGRARGAEATLPGREPLVLADTGEVSSAGPGHDAVEEGRGEAGALATITGLRASSVRGDDASVSVVEAGEVRIHTSPPVAIRDLKVVAAASCPEGHAGSTVASIQVGDDPPVVLDARRNMAIPLGAFTLLVNRQTFTSHGVTVHGIELVGQGVRLEVGYATAAVAGCVGTGDPAGDVPHEH